LATISGAMSQRYREHEDQVPNRYVGQRPDHSSVAGVGAELHPGHSLAPGVIHTPINTAAWNTLAAYSSLMILVPYKRIGEPDDIAQAAVWLASDAADDVTGATLFVDGGMALDGFRDRG